MKVNYNTWKSRMLNLMERRRVPKKRQSDVVSDYGAHLKKVHVGKSVLDVGCGTMAVKSLLPANVKYTGLDPFPVSSEVVSGMIEEEGIEQRLPEIDTVICFAVMDGCMDFSAACSNIKKIAQENVVFLTGIGIAPDQYHTFELQLSDYRGAFVGWKETVCEAITDKIYLLEYTK